MITWLKKHILIITSVLTLAAPMIAPVAVNAAGPCNTNIANGINSGITATEGTNTTGGGQCGTSATSGVSSIARHVIDIFSLVVGVISVFMIVYAGFRYIISGGDSGNTSGARNTLLYAIVGLIIVAIAQIIVRFVLHTANGIQ